jgi:uncharacterized membrane protein YeaQ/YmgE (transglycosylase-associated protein family)
MRNRTAMASFAVLPVILAQDGGGGDKISLDLGSILLYALIGAVIGIIARLIVPGTGGMSWVLTIVVGIIGALVGGWLAGAVFEETKGVDWIASILVAALLVFLVARMGRGGYTRRRAL